jgi:enoyl-CoA hydratase
VSRPEPASAGLRYEVDGAIATIVLDRPERHNALTIDSVEALAACSREAQEDDAVRVIVLTGAGDRAFCVGGDLEEFLPRMTDGELSLLLPDPSKRFFSDVFKPVVAAVNGLCIGGGLELLLGTDIRVASEEAVFGLGETRWGVIPGAGAHVRLPGQIPWAIAMQLLLTAEPIGAQRAFEVGLVNELAAPADVLERAMAIAATIARNAPVAVQTAKEIAVRALAHEQAFALEYALNERVLRTEDAREGPRAFVEKREPRYRAR